MSHQVGVARNILAVSVFFVTFGTANSETQFASGGTTELAANEAIDLEKNKVPSPEGVVDCRHLDGIYSGTCQTKTTLFEESKTVTISIKQPSCNEFIVGRNDDREFIYEISGTLASRPSYISYRKANFDSSAGIIHLSETFMGRDGATVESHQTHIEVIADDSISYEFENFNLRAGKKFKVISCALLKRTGGEDKTIEEAPSPNSREERLKALDQELKALDDEPDPGDENKATNEGEGKSFIIVKDDNKKCIVLEGPATDSQSKNQIGKSSYPTLKEANIDVRVLCDN